MSAPTNFPHVLVYAGEPPLLIKASRLELLLVVATAARKHRAADPELDAALRAWETAL